MSEEKDPSFNVMNSQVKPVAESGFSLVPRTMTEALQFAEVMSKSDLVPKDYKGNAGNVLIAVQMGAEIGLKPMQAMQNIAVINGKPGLYGDAGKALLLAGGCIIDEDDTQVVQQNKRARCKITRPNGVVTERTFSVEDATTAGLWKKAGPWSQYPFRQMAWRAFWFAARDGCADMLKGMNGAEELVDYPEREINPIPTNAEARTDTLDEKLAKRAEEERNRKSAIEGQATAVQGRAPADIFLDVEKMTTKEQGEALLAEIMAFPEGPERKAMGAAWTARVKLLKAEAAPVKDDFVAGMEREEQRQPGQDG